MKKPINLFTYVLAFISWSYSFNHSIWYLILAIILLFHAYMSCDIIKEPGDE